MSEQQTYDCGECPRISTGCVGRCDKAPIDPDAAEWHRRNDAQALRLQIQEQSRGFMPERGGYRGQP